MKQVVAFNLVDLLRYKWFDKVRTPTLNSGIYIQQFTQVAFGCLSIQQLNRYPNHHPCWDLEQLQGTSLPTSPTNFLFYIFFLYCNQNILLIPFMLKHVMFSVKKQMLWCSRECQKIMGCQEGQMGYKPNLPLFTRSSCSLHAHMKLKISREWWENNRLKIGISVKVHF